MESVQVLSALALPVLKCNAVQYSVDESSFHGSRALPAIACLLAVADPRIVSGAIRGGAAA
jgi:hypothetical protein